MKKGNSKMRPNFGFENPLISSLIGSMFVRV